MGHRDHILRQLALAQPIVPSLLWLCDLPGQENSPDTSHLIIIAARASFSYLKSQGFECK
jgi:hypothetical protein